MKAVVLAYTRAGCQTARRAAAVLGPETWLYAPERLAGEGIRPIPQPPQPFYGACFSRAEALVFIGSAGIALRAVAPFLKSKQSDPAVLCLDPEGVFVIPLLSGHIGGANRLARELAAALGATAVLTTASDVQGKFAADAWAAEHNCAISDMKTAKAVAATILEAPVGIASEFSLPEPLPEGLAKAESGPLGIYIGCRRIAPFDTTLRLIPRILHLGIGCRKGTTAQAIAQAVDAVLEGGNFDPQGVACAASIDLKEEEAGLLEFCRRRQLPIRFYTAQELAAVEGSFSPSAFVREVTGVDNVCERAALLGAETLLVKKTVWAGVTVALAAEAWEVQFG